MRSFPRPEDRGAPRALREQLFRIALICTGNRFRSPLAEGFLRRYGHDLPLMMQSFGTRDIGPLPPLPEALEAATTYGLELDRHRACSVRGTRLADVDLVIGFERTHVATAVVDAGASRQRTFTLPELARLLSLLPALDGPPNADRARARVAGAHDLRAARGSSHNFAELGDPLGGPARGYSDMAGQLADLCVDVLQGLFGHSTRIGRGETQVQSRQRG